MSDEQAALPSRSELRQQRRTTAPAAHPRRRRRLIGLVAVLTVVVLGSDQATKYLAEARLDDGVFVSLWDDYLGLQLVYNSGAAFGLADGLTWVLTIVAIAVALAVVRFARKLGSLTWAVALGLLLGGCLGNLYDRLAREPGIGRGHVVDFINYNGWFIGNVADIAIVVAAGLIVILALAGREIDGTRHADAEKREPDTAAGQVSEEPAGEDTGPHSAGPGESTESAAEVESDEDTGASPDERSGA
ncbi:signal peptidase II [Bogoriella caseilytica]|uniref:Lipoprotein signal peptidase n=1 Tax=Bogoriella caseilytica TaxID=56055 RepID=A0A3N2B9L9_9MICO|nr:signal peptidase II [Bogoriella caseilytica]ROR71832.1 signal peptidase II [Bogoriella caseilytica]